MKTCTNCNNQVEDNKKFCNKCGTPVSNVVVSQGDKIDYLTFSMLAVIGWNILIPAIFLIPHRFIGLNSFEIELLNYVVLLILLGAATYFSKTRTPRIILAFFLFVVIILLYFYALDPMFG